MRKLIFISILIIASVFLAVAQSPCPTISVTGPSKITAIGDSITFTANIVGGNFENIKFEWTVTAGAITKGQGTSTITVATNADLAGQTIIALVKASGLAQNCKNEAASFGEIATPINCGSPRVLDDYGKLSWMDEKARLQNVVIEIKNNDNAIAYFMISASEKGRSQSFKNISVKIEKYLTGQHKISKERMKFVFVENGEKNVRIYILPIIPTCR